MFAAKFFPVCVVKDFAVGKPEVGMELDVTEVAFVVGDMTDEAALADAIAALAAVDIASAAVAIALAAALAVFEFDVPISVLNCDIIVGSAAISAATAASNAVCVCVRAGDGVGRAATVITLLLQFAGTF
jgi:hypothetical protein